MAAHGAAPELVTRDTAYIDGNSAKDSTLRGNRCRCGACGEHFHSVGAFDMHRVGRYQPMERRCLSSDEMHNKGMVQRPDGFWTTGKPISSSLRVGHSGGDLGEAAQMAVGIWNTAGKRPLQLPRVLSEAAT